MAGHEVWESTTRHRRARKILPRAWLAVAGWSLTSRIHHAILELTWIQLQIYFIIDVTIKTLACPTVTCPAMTLAS